MYLLLFFVLCVDKYSSQFGGGINPYAYYHEEDESSFQLVDSSRVQKPVYQKNRNRYNQVRNQSTRKTGTMTTREIRNRDFYSHIILPSP